MNPRVALWIAVCAIAMTLTGIWGQRRDAARLVAQLTAVRDSLRHRSDSVRTVFVRDTVHLTRTVVRYERLRAQVDTQWLRDTVPVPVEVVREVVRAADTTVRACRETVRSCAEGLRLADSTRRVDSLLIVGLRRETRPKWRQLGSALLVGAVAGMVLNR